MPKAQNGTLEPRAFGIAAQGAAINPKGKNPAEALKFVKSDEGIVGYGEGGWPEIVEAGVRDLAPLLIGEDPFAAEWIWLKIYDILHGHGLTGAVRGRVQSAIDIAFWDIKGKALGVPVHVLLGGAVRDRIRVYGHASTPELARELVAEGYTAFKCRPSAQVLADLLGAVGDGIDIGCMRMASLRSTRPCRARAAEPDRPAFLEEPTHFSTSVTPRRMLPSSQLYPNTGGKTITTVAAHTA